LGDHTTRPQILERDRNPGFYDLIQEFRERTGIGVVLNTSFNLHGEPIVDTPEDALHVLEHSGLTHLALGDWLITKL
jgi:carbamoyltransferase